MISLSISNIYATLCTVIHKMYPTFIKYLRNLVLGNPSQFQEEKDDEEKENILDSLPSEIWDIILPMLECRQILFLCLYSANLRVSSCALKKLQEENLLAATSMMNPRTAIEAALTLTGFTKFTIELPRHKTLASPRVVLDRIKKENPGFILPPHYVQRFRFAEDRNYVLPPGGNSSGNIEAHIYRGIEDAVEKSFKNGVGSIFHCFLLGQYWRPSYVSIISSCTNHIKRITIVSAILAGHVKDSLLPSDENYIIYCKLGMGVYPEDGISKLPCTDDDIRGVVRIAAWGGTLHRLLLDNYCHDIIRNHIRMIIGSISTIILERYHVVGLKDLNYILWYWKDRFVGKEMISVWIEEFNKMDNADLFWNGRHIDSDCAEGCIDPNILAKVAVKNHPQGYIFTYLKIAFDKGPIFMNTMISHLHSSIGVSIDINRIVAENLIRWDEEYQNKFFKEFGCYHNNMCKPFLTAMS